MRDLPVDSIADLRERFRLYQNSENMLDHKDQDIIARDLEALSAAMAQRGHVPTDQPTKAWRAASDLPTNQPTNTPKRERVQAALLANP